MSYFAFPPAPCTVMKRYLTALLLTGGFLHFHAHTDSSTSRRSNFARRRSNRRGNQTRLVGNRAIAAPPSATKLGECGSNTPGHVPVFFVHLHKSGGTTFMKLASVNGWCTPKGGQGVMEQGWSWSSQDTTGGKAVPFAVRKILTYQYCFLVFGRWS